MKKVLFIGLVDVEQNNGDSLHFKRLTNYMSDFFDITIISFTKKKDKKWVYIKFPKYKLLRLLYWNLIVFYKIVRISLSNKQQLIYFRESGLLLSPYLAKKILNIPIITEINGITIHDLPLSTKVTIPLFKWGYNNANKIVASIGYCDFINKVFNISYYDLVKVRLGYNFNMLNKNDSGTNSEFLFNSKNFNKIVFIGNIAKYQGLDLFLEGFAKYLLVNSNTHLHIIGDGESKQSLAVKVKNLKIEPFVFFHSKIPQQELTHILKQCDLGISPFSSQRGFPKTISGLKTFDYLNAELPILTSIMDDMCDFIIENKIGKCIVNFTAEEIGGLIADCLSGTFQKEVYESYSQNFEKWKDVFSWDNRFNKIRKSILECSKK